jgi:hypothetical protein
MRSLINIHRMMVGTRPKRICDRAVIFAANVRQIDPRRRYGPSIALLVRHGRRNRELLLPALFKSATLAQIRGIGRSLI